MPILRNLSYPVYQPQELSERVAHLLLDGEQPLKTARRWLLRQIDITNTAETADGGVIQRAAELGERIKNALVDHLAGLNHVRDVRGKGMMIAVELNNPCTDLIQQALSKGLLLNVTTDTVLRLLPPLNLTDDEADEIVTIVTSLVQAAGS